MQTLDFSTMVGQLFVCHSTETWCLYVVWEKQEQIGQKIVHSLKYALPYTQCWV